MYRHDAAIKVAVGDSVLGAVLRLHSQRVQLFTAEILQRGDHVRADALMWLRVNLAQMQVAAIDGAVVILRHPRRGVGHHLHTAGDAEIVHAAHNICCG